MAYSERSGGTVSKPGIEQRVGGRVPVDGLSLEWVPYDPRRSRLRRSPKPAPARLVDLSVSGASLRAAHGVDVDALMQVRLDGFEGLVRVRRVERDDAGSGTARYGVAFVWLEAGLQERLYALVAHGQGADRYTPDMLR
jgi:hypothetical protein